MVVRFIIVLGIVGCATAAVLSQGPGAVRLAAVAIATASVLLFFRERLGLWRSRCIKTVNGNLPVPGKGEARIDPQVGVNGPVRLVVEFDHGRNALNGTIKIDSKVGESILVRLPRQNADDFRVLHSFPVAVSVKIPESSLNSVICVTFELDWNFKEERTRAKYRVGESEGVRIRILGRTPRRER